MNQNKKRGARAAARLAAVQALYQMDLVGTDAKNVIADRERCSLQMSDDEDPQISQKPDGALFQDIVYGFIREQNRLDPIVNSHLASGWRLARIGSTLRAILRAATYELCCREDIPARVVLDEYVNLAHYFLCSEEVRTVNGVLDAVARSHRLHEFTK